MAPHDAWEYSTPALRGLSYRFAVRADDARVGRDVDLLLAGLRDECDETPVDNWYALRSATDGSGTFDVVRDDADLRALEAAGATGALVATALHEGRLTL